MDILASADGSLTNPSKLASTFQGHGQKRVSDKTIRRCIGFLVEAFLMEEAKRYDIKGRKYIGTLMKCYYGDVDLRNARLNFRQQEENHLMENVICNELRYRGWAVDVGVVGLRERSGDGSLRSKQLEVDFMANKGSRRVYVQSAFAMPDSAKERQEKRSLSMVQDSFKKIVVVRGPIKPWQDDQGIVTLGLFDFLLDSESWE